MTQAHSAEDAQSSTQIPALDKNPDKNPAQTLELALEPAVQQAELTRLNSLLQTKTIALKKTEQALEESQQRYQLAMQASGEGLWDWNVLTDEVYYSPRIEEILGCKEGTLAPHFGEFESRLHPDDKAAILATVQAHLNQQVPYDVEYRLRNQQGGYIWVNARGQALWDEAGKPVRMAGSIVDITHRKQVESRLQGSLKALADLKSALDSSSIVEITDRQGRILEANDKFCEISRYRREQLLGKTHRLVNSGYHPPEFFQQMWQAISAGKVWHGEIKNRTQNGDCYWVDTTIVPILDALGQPERYVAIRNDITERKQFEQALEESETRWQFALEGARDGVWDWNAQTNQVFFSHQWKAMLGYGDDEVGDGLDEWDSRVHPDDKEQCYADLQRHLSGEVPFYQNEHRVRCKDGSYLWVLDRGKVIERDEAGQPLRVIGTHADITPLKQAEAALRQLNEALEAKVQARTQELAQRAQELERSNADLQQFAYVASHDLQEPLRTISSFTELLAAEYGDRLDGEAEEYMAFIVEGASRMQQLIQDLLSYSRVGTRGRAFVPTDCEVVLHRALGNLKFAITESQATITHDPLPTVLADSAQVQQLLQNLLSNALKFRNQTPPCIHISAEPAMPKDFPKYLPKDVAESADSAGGFLDGQGERSALRFWRFCVRDNGIGIEPAYHEQIFEIFQRLHSRRLYAGTGIGLAICRKIVQRHGGRIWVESEPDVGASFYFTLPNLPQRSDSVDG